MKSAGLPLGAGIVAAMLALAGCGEKPQISERSARKSDNAAWSVSAEAVPGFYAPGWKATGDKAAWEAQINARAQGQNDYAAR